MSFKERFGLLERRRPTRETPVVQVGKRFSNLGEEQRASLPPPASAVPIREESHSAPVVREAPAPGDPWRDRILAVLLVGWLGPRIIGAFGRLVSFFVVLALLAVMLATGLLARGCAAMRGDYDSAVPSEVRR